MLTDLYQALCSRLHAAGCPVYADDCVPPDASFPFITLRAEPSLSPGGKGMLTLSCWHHSCTAHADRLVLADRLLELFPAGGMLLTLPDALAVITPGAAAACGMQASARGISLPFCLRIYPRRPRKENALD